LDYAYSVVDIYGVVGCDREGMEMRVDFRDVLFWAFLILTVVLLFWYMFGNSPMELFVSSGIAGLVLVKMWNFNERLTRVEIGTKHGFDMMKRDVDLVKGDLGLIKRRLGI